MMRKTTYLFVTLFALFLLAACTSPEPAADVVDDMGQAGDVIEEADSHATDEMMDEDETMEDDMMHEDSDGDAMAESDDMHEESDDDAMAESDDMHEDSDGDAMAESDDMHEGSDDDAMSEDSMADASMPRPAWQQIALTNARTGETFTLADFSGKTVFIEPMATWCTNCLQQLRNVSTARAQLSGEDTIFIGLSLETNISDEDLARYADGQGFDWLFAVMTPELLQELANEFGRAITSAPSTPHFLILPDGSITELTTGIESPDELLQVIQAAQA